MSGTMARDAGTRPLRVLVAIASYGTSNDRYLERIIQEYGSMSLDVHVVVLSNIEKSVPPDVECLVGLPTKNPWSLPFGHKKLFADRCERYDLFIYSEDDILITEDNLRAWLDVNVLLAEDEIAGFMRVEFGKDGTRSYPDVHGHFRWDPTSTRRRGNYALAHFTNEHAACYILTRAQLSKALRSGGFDVVPHEGKYDLLCTAATDPYTQCGLTKLIPFSHLDLFSVHHMSNRYVGKMGVTADEFDNQRAALLQIAQKGVAVTPLIPAETRLWNSAYAKDYYAPVAEEVVSLIPKTARSVLSIGCDTGATERWLVNKGFRVAAIPLDPVIASGAASDGVEMIYDDADRAGLTERAPFDCVLYLNVLHLTACPQALLSWSRAFMHSNSTLIVQSPNMMSLRRLRRLFSDSPSVTPVNGYESTGAHFSSSRAIRSWCAGSGFRIEQVLGVFPSSEDGLFGMASAISSHLPGVLSFPFTTSIVVTATKVQLPSAKPAVIAELPMHGGPTVRTRDLLQEKARAS
jgi:2-polyprenyl-3-methyl-5-hydroxy-6-metoxy-1,4-benzoquinol methylase